MKAFLNIPVLVSLGLLVSGAVGTPSGRLMTTHSAAADENFSSIQWSFPSPTGKPPSHSIFTGPVGSSSRTVVLAYRNASAIGFSHTYEVYCLEASTGSVRWEKTWKFGNNVHMMLATPDGSGDVFVHGGSQARYDGRTGEQLWTASQNAGSCGTGKLLTNYYINPVCGFFVNLETGEEGLFPGGWISYSGNAFSFDAQGPMMVIMRLDGSDPSSGLPRINIGRFDLHGPNTTMAWNSTVTLTTEASSLTSLSEGNEVVISEDGTTLYGLVQGGILFYLDVVTGVQLGEAKYFAGFGAEDIYTNDLRLRRLIFSSGVLLLNAPRSASIVALEASTLRTIWQNITAAVKNVHRHQTVFITDGQLVLMHVSQQDGVATFTRVDWASGAAFKQFTLTPASFTNVFVGAGTLVATSDNDFQGVYTYVYNVNKMSSSSSSPTPIASFSQNVVRDPVGTGGTHYAGDKINRENCIDAEMVLLGNGHNGDGTVHLYKWKA